MPRTRIFAVVLGALGALAALSVLGLADARTVPSRRTARAVKQRPMPLLRLFVAMPSGPSDREVSLLGFFGAAEVGKTYVLADEEGYVGDVKVVAPDQGLLRDAGRCGLHEARARFLGRPRRPLRGTAYAFGPTERPLVRLRVEPVERTRGAGGTSPDLPPGRDSRGFALDGDGDGAPDYAWYAVDCGAGRRARSFPQCLESWSRRGGTWELVERADLNCP